MNQIIKQLIGAKISFSDVEYFSKQDERYIHYYIKITVNRKQWVCQWTVSKVELETVQFDLLQRAEDRQIKSLINVVKLGVGL